MNNIKRKIHTMYVRRLQVAVKNKRLVVQPCATGGLTISWKEEGGKLRFAVARCHHTDHYEKRLGRALTLQRLSDNITFTCDNSLQKTPFETLREFIVRHNTLRRSLKPDIRRK